VFGKLAAGFALLIALAGCGRPSYRLLDGVDLSKPGRWYVIYRDDDRTSVLEGADRLRAARSQLTTSFEWETFDLFGGPPIAGFTLVRDGVRVTEASVHREEHISRGASAEAFVPVSTCHADLDRRTVDAYLRRFHSGRILVADIPSIPYDHAFTVDFPTYALETPTADRGDATKSEELDRRRTENVERELDAMLHRMFPADRFSTAVTTGVVIGANFVDAADRPVMTADGRQMTDTNDFVFHTPTVVVSAPGRSLFDRMRRRVRELARLDGMPPYARTIAPHIAALERSHPRLPEPIAIDLGIRATVDASVDDWHEVTLRETYWVKRRPCLQGSDLRVFKERRTPNST
jgi:hypothetical protein